MVEEAKEKDSIRWGSSSRGTLWRISELFGRRLRQQGVATSVEIESKDGSMLTEKNEIKYIWREYFSELLEGEQMEEV